MRTRGANMLKGAAGLEHRGEVLGDYFHGIGAYPILSRPARAGTAIGNPILAQRCERQQPQRAS
jgi:glutamate synthase domain-containing protein 1